MTPEPTGRIEDRGLNAFQSHGSTLTKETCELGREMAATIASLREEVEKSNFTIRNLRAVVNAWKQNTTDADAISQELSKDLATLKGREEKAGKLIQALNGLCDHLGVHGETGSTKYRVYVRDSQAAYESRAGEKK